MAENVVPFIACRRNYIFQHDNARSFFKSHKRRSSAKQHTVEVMPWPALSPYLDPIEHLRDEIQSRRNEIQPRQADNCS